MKQQPNPALKNTAIYVGNDEVLRKKAIEYYEKNGYKLQHENGKYQYIGTFLDSHIFFTDFINIGKRHTIITLPTETESEYPKMMMVSDNEDLWVEVLVVCKFKDIFIAQSVENKACFHSWKFAKPIPTTTLTVAELVEFYEKSNNVKVEVKQNTTETTN